MALSDGDKACGVTRQLIEYPQEVFRVIDDGDVILTTLDPRKALLALMNLIEKHDVTSCWADLEVLK